MTEREFLQLAAAGILAAVMAALLLAWAWTSYRDRPRRNRYRSFMWARIALRRWLRARAERRLQRDMGWKSLWAMTGRTRCR